ncbi:hypothetical protein PAPYR_11019 [Paratrimastix pyriformis]|uniref:Secreted protein n=1 Tax=Paratrimastix pyriformis TaxID=342808 RepID=A0ABQ8U8K5_9EUKA|nr:hypothetical protein PAPYR_11019 [Paratrimastix pyriformis]
MTNRFCAVFGVLTVLFHTGSGWFYFPSRTCDVLHPHVLRVFIPHGKHALFRRVYPSDSFFGEPHLATPSDEFSGLVTRHSPTQPQAFEDILNVTFSFPRLDETYFCVRHSFTVSDQVRELLFYRFRHEPFYSRELLLDSRGTTGRSADHHPSEKSRAFPDVPGLWHHHHGIFHSNITTTFVTFLQKRILFFRRVSIPHGVIHQRGLIQFLLSTCPQAEVCLPCRWESPHRVMSTGG